MNTVKKEYIEKDSNIQQCVPKLVSEEGGDRADVVSIDSVIIKNFKKWMRRNNLEDSTIESYIRTIKDYKKKYKTVSKNSLLAYRLYLIDNYNPRTANQRICAINKYLEYINKKTLKLKHIRIQTRPYLENIISKNDYRYFIRCLKKEGATKVYFLVKFIACTGVRPSELVKFRVDHVESGWMDIYSKGGKIRRIYIPEKLQKEAIEWIHSESMESGTIFKNKDGQTITTRGVNKLLKEYAAKTRIPLETVYCYSFRHFFAKSFLEKNNNLLLLADLMGHSSIETTRIYSRLTAREQREIISKTVDW